MKKKIKRTGIRMPEHLNQQIQFIADYEGCPKNHFIVRELRKSVNLYKKENLDFLEWLKKGE